VRYVEWLYAGRVLKWTAVALGIALLLLIIAEFAVLNFGSKAALSQVDLHTAGGDVNAAEILEGATTTHSILPDGANRTTIENARRGVRVTIDDRGYWGKHIEIFERAVLRPSHTIAFGPVNVVRVRARGGSKVAIDTNKPEDFAYYAAIATFVALIVATILGAPLARQNDGHLEIALTSPTSRTALGLGSMVVDAAAIAVTWVMTVLGLFIAHIVQNAPNYRYGPLDTLIVVLGLAGVLAWYAMLCAATASMKRSYGVVLGIAWPIAVVVAWLVKANLADSPMAQFLRWVATPLSWIDPLNYVHLGPAFTINGRPAGALDVSFNNELPALLILALIYVALAIVQWRRVEA
jgi:hypothetical protein